MDYLSGSDISLRVLFQNKEQTFVPDSGSVRLNLRGETGALLITDQAVTVAPGANSATITILAVHNTLLPSQKYARRTAHVVFTAGGQTYNLFFPYRITSWLNHSVDVEKVRHVLGANFNDLPDGAVDIVQAYYEAEGLVPDIDDKLIAGGMDEFYANEIIVCLAALKVLPSLRLGAAVQEDNGAISFRRFAAVDWDALAEALRSRVNTALGILTNSDLPASTLLIFATRPDPITGE